MKRKWMKIGKNCCLIFMFLIVGGLVFPTWTPGIDGENSISTLEQVQINGTGLEVMIRGVDKHNPIVIFVHGGPGCSEIPYVRKYQDVLEQNFTIVQYDQRGSGKSYHFFEDYTKLSTDVLVDDLVALTDYVTKKVGQQPVLLIGHSFGTYIGMKAAATAPEKFAAYIGIGQVSNPVQSELDSLAYTIEQAKRAGNQGDADKLALLHDAIAQGNKRTPRDMVQKYGGAARGIDDNMDYYTGFLLHREYNLLDVIRFLRGISVSQDVLLTEEANHPITSIVTHLDIPCFFVMGNYDYMTSTHAASEYFAALQAPVKQFVRFEQSAHYPQFEEKALFAKWLTEMWKELSENRGET